MGAAAFDNIAQQQQQQHHQHQQQQQQQQGQQQHQHQQQSLLSRRPAASALQNFVLPQSSSLFQSAVTSTTSAAGSPSRQYPLPSNTTPPQSTSTAKVNSLLTPPSNQNLNPFSLPPNQFPSYSQGYWTNSPSYTFSGRSNSNSNSLPDGVPSYHQVPPYQSPLPTTSPSSEPSSHHHDQHDQSQNSQHPQSMAHIMMSAQPSSGGISPAPPPHTALDGYGHQQKMYGTPPSHSAPPPPRPPPQSYQQYQTAPPSLHQPPTTTAQMSPNTAQFPQFCRPYPSYSLPAMNGPVMSNLHNPNSQMALLGSMQPNLPPGFNSGHSAATSMQHMYGQQGHPHGGHSSHQHHPGHGMMQHGGAGGPQTDRPFRCDQCPQSFSRNHDLKRHKRIHLAVKPFPCKHCDKSFSRKDALKRHILVKGCGQDHPVDNSNSGTASASSSTTTPALKDENTDRHSDTS